MKKALATLGVMLLTLALPVDVSALGFAPANAGIAARVQEEFVGARNIFVNCPGNNQVAAGLNCETRFLYRGKVRIAYGIAEPDSEAWQEAHWSSPGLIIDHPPAYRRWMHCPTGGLSRFDEVASGFRLRTYATTCESAHYLAGLILAYAIERRNWRLPKHFAYDDSEGQKLGFILKRMSCSTRIEARQGNPNPYGHEIAYCRNRFFDRFEFAFDQGS